MHILIIEDDLIIGKNIETALTEESFEVTLARDSQTGEAAIKQKKFDCIVLDINLPGKNGFEVCKSLRINDQVTPVLLLTAFDELEDKVKGYESGVDDYLTKPFYMKELSLRIHALIKRKQGIERQNGDNIISETIDIKDLHIDLKHKKVFKNSNEIPLTPREFQILIKLVEAGGAPVSKQELIKEIWGSLFDHNTNTIEVYVNFLRNKIDKPYQTNLIKTRIGYGYYLDINNG